VTTIIIIDDDYSTEILAENLRFRGFEARRINSADEAFRSIDAIVSANLVILDIIMQRPEVAGARSISGDSTTGMALLQAIRKAKPDLPVLVYSATENPSIVDAIRRTPHTLFLPKWATPKLKEVVRIAESVLGVNGSTAGPRSFIVHGHDEVMKLALKNYLQNTLHLPEPIILHEQPNLGRTIIEKFEDYASRIDLVFVLLTPDDLIVAATKPDDEKRRARQNVIFELGYFLGMMGRSSGRVFLLYKGSLELPSDLSGIVYIDISSGVDAAGEKIRKELANVPTL
jgi:DNA-binding NarL/FixJ family response regulator